MIEDIVEQLDEVKTTVERCVAGLAAEQAAEHALDEADVRAILAPHCRGCSNWPDHSLPIDVSLRETCHGLLRVQWVSAAVRSQSSVAFHLADSRRVAQADLSSAAAHESLIHHATTKTHDVILQEFMASHDGVLVNTTACKRLF